MQPYYKAMGFKQGDFPASERYYEEALTLSLYVGLTDEEQEMVVEALEKVLTNS
ncbi:DegT/DnrJ/EryC1/StrS family aminotransferase [uncultured Selenomonas sp.]|uniref:DegT/DnrJ/EryC1/StrS family aminotransferase n=1 Tax=uncultured Selenomonas sp. TaxID=159275 RepID=UPI0026292EB7|nr:DegT/DnrJ/EryC1/StrS family aminotransferase [uncultured Selenomonas sp.]